MTPSLVEMLDSRPVQSVFLNATVFATGVTMRAIIACLILIIASGAASAQGKKGEPIPPPAGQVKTDFSYFEYWNLSLKSFSLDVVEQRLTDGRIVHFGKITYVLEFYCDVPFLQLEPLQRNMEPDQKK